MVRLCKSLLKDAGTGLSKTLSEILVCPLSKQPLRFSEETASLISDSIGVSFPIKDGIPCLVPRDGKILDIDDTMNDAAADSARTNKELAGSGDPFILLFPCC
ncbi:hypothetical protein QUC31_002769 [Theobroma cacao]|uniref:Protein preY, mitochondrial n=2 Tax=Theobroma cacao TaxID=3641 RepID=A0AB32VLZ5_THECC|nr:PREDICTED: UPF0434 protein Daci_3569 [Theobroma cacao]EOX90782.1 Uncharacterized protein TCM_000154 [Theobroma cacao]WRX10100.1 Trm112-like - like 1 [Theobroma cacao]